jgi:hypothetical protein
LGVLVILIGFTLYWTNLRPPEEVGSEATPIPESPWEISISDFERIEITNSNEGKYIKLSRDLEGNWMEIAPLEGQLDSEVVENSVHWLTSPFINRVISTREGLKQFGLDEPAGMIKIITSSDDVKILLIGNVAPTGNQTYTIVPGTSDVLLIDSIVVNSIMDLVGIELLMPPMPEETQTDVEPGVP